jgi:hypothetical protein
LTPNHTPASLLKRLTAPVPSPPESTRMPRFTPHAIQPLPSLLLSPN